MPAIFEIKLLLALQKCFIQICHNVLFESFINSFILTFCCGPKKKFENHKVIKIQGLLYNGIYINELFTDQILTLTLFPSLWQLYVHDIGAEDWRIAMTTNRLALIALELAVAIIHPYPVGLLAYVHQTPARMSLSETELEIMLALPMFLRLYLLGRAMMLHSRLFTDTASRSIGALNKVGGHLWVPVRITLWA